MPTLDDLISQPHLQLRFLRPEQQARYGRHKVTEIAAPSPDAAANANAGTLARTPLPPQHSPDTIHDLIRRLSARKAAGLVLHVPADTDTDAHVSTRTRVLADTLKIPLLVTSAPAEAWGCANAMLQRQRALHAEQQCAALDGLLARMPARLSDPEATQRVAEWLAAATDADVLVTSERRGILAAASAENRPGAKDSENFERVVPIVTGTTDNTQLTVYAPAPYDAAAKALTQHAAKMLGLCDQARQTRRAIRHAVFQLLMRGETVLAQAIYTGTKTVLDTDTARVFVIDTGHEEREPTLQWCEAELADAALVCPCPGKPRHILVLDPGRDGARVETLLKAMVASRPGHAMGLSRTHPLTVVATSYMEALSAVAQAARRPERVSQGGTEAKVAQLLPRAAAHAWARDLLAPLLSPSRTHEQLLKTLPLAVGFRLVEAAAALQVHRNTVIRRLTRAGDLLGLDLRNSVSDRILVLLAVDVLALPPQEAEPRQETPEFAELISARPTADAIRTWAHRRLRPLLRAGRHAVNVLCTWIENDLEYTATAHTLDLPESTVRYHVKEACAELGIDRAPNLPDTDVITIADIAIALHVLLGRPELRQPNKTPCPR